MSAQLPATHIRVLQYCARCTSTMGEDLVPQNWYLLNDTSLVFDFAILFSAGLNEPFRQRVVAEGNRFLIGAKHEHNYLQQLIFYYQLFRMMRTQPEHAVCVHESTPLFLIPCWLAKLAGIKKIIVLSHNAIAACQPRWLKYFHAFVFRFIVNIRLAVSQKAGIALYGEKLPFQVIYNGIDTRKFAYRPNIREAMRKKLALGNHPTFGFIGRFENEKNILFLLDVFKAIHHQNNHARFILVGSGSLQHSVLQKIEELQLRPFIQWLPSSQNTSEIYQALDAFILPSLYEGLALVLLEAQAAGLPVFMSDAIAHEAIICNTTVIPLAYSADKWASFILEKTKNFYRTDQSSCVRDAGFDITTQLKRLEKICRTN